MFERALRFVANHIGLTDYIRSVVEAEVSTLKGELGALQERVEPFGPEDDVHVREVRAQFIRSIAYVIGSAVEGSVAEFGTGTGRSSTLLAYAMALFQRRYGYSDPAHGIGERKLLLFDSFEGLPAASSEIDASSPHVAKGIWGTGGCKGGITPEQLRTMCAQYLDKDRIQVFPGWFKDTLAEIPEDITKFALVHIDCDLYESAAEVLNHLFNNNLLADGAVLMFDDWNCNRASPRFGERRAWGEAVQQFTPQYSDCGDYGIAGHKFIIHDSATQ